MTLYHIERHGNAYVVKDDKGGYHGEYKSRKEAQAMMYELMKKKG
jgi:hypothetical protein